MQLQKWLKRLEYKHLEELKSKSDALQRVQADLLSKSEEVTTLQITARTSLEADKLRRRSSDSSPRSSLDSPRGSHDRHHRLSCDSAAESVASSSSSGPHPPSTSYAAYRSSGRRSLNSVINRPASGRKLIEDEGPDENATAEILEITKSQRLQLQGAATSKLLPPIPPTAPPTGPPRLHKANSAAFSRRKPPVENKEPVNVETLAIDQVNGGTRKINLRRAHEFNSQDGS